MRITQDVSGPQRRHAFQALDYIDRQLILFEVAAGFVLKNISHVTEWPEGVSGQRRIDVARAQQLQRAGIDKICRQAQTVRQFPLEADRRLDRVWRS